MLEKFIYETHSGLRFEGLANGVYLNYNDLRNYSWSYDTINSRISRFYRSVTSRKLPLVIKCDSAEKAIAVKHRLLDLCETDIEAKIPGKIFVGDCYTTGYITASSKSEYLITKQYCKLELTLTSADPTWYRDQTYVFNPNQLNVSGTGIDYPFDYNFDYKGFSVGKNIVVDSVRGNAFKMRIYGYAENPSVSIGGHTYSVSGVVGENENLFIDSLSKTITLTTASGSKMNWFDRRNRESYIFELIQPGQVDVTWSGSFAFDLTIIERRSEPRWI